MYIEENYYNITVTVFVCYSTLTFSNLSFSAQLENNLAFDELTTNVSIENSTQMS